MWVELQQQQASKSRCKNNLQLGKLPYVWKSLNITPIYKKGSKEQPSNYRLVKLTCILCTLLESLIREDLVSNMKLHHILSKRQFVFINGRSTTLQLLYLMDE